MFLNFKWTILSDISLFQKQNYAVRMFQNSLINSYYKKVDFLLL